MTRERLIANGKCINELSQESYYASKKSLILNEPCELSINGDSNQ